MSEPRLSIVIPAFNEGRRLPATLAAVRAAAAGAGIKDYELIVSDDQSSDDTADVARGFGARVVSSGKRNIGATRNVGAAQAAGRCILFLDADTQPHAAALTAMLAALDGGAVAGGTLLKWTAPAPFWSRQVLNFWNVFSPLFRLPAGGFLFVRREDFNAVGGFDERYFASEELHLAFALKRRGPVVILKEKVATSPHKFEHFSKTEIARLLLRSLCSPRKALKDRSYLAFWYDRRS